MFNMIRGAFPRSKSNSKAQEIEDQHGGSTSVNFDHKNEDFSESVNSFHPGAISQSSLGHQLSSDAFAVSILSSERISYWRTCSGMTPKNKIFMTFRVFSKSTRNHSVRFQDASGVFGTHPGHEMYAQGSLVKHEKITFSAETLRIFTNFQIS